MTDYESRATEQIKQVIIGQAVGTRTAAFDEFAEKLARRIYNECGRNIYEGWRQAMDEAN